MGYSVSCAALVNRRSDVMNMKVNAIRCCVLLFILFINVMGEAECLVL